MNYKIFKIIFIVLLCMLVGSIGVNKTNAQEDNLQEHVHITSLLNQKIQLDIKHASLSALLKLISKQTGINFIADGEPPPIYIDFNADDTLRKILDTLCEKFDYTWKPTKSGLIVMNKHFFHGDTLPQVHLAETMQSAKNIIDALSALPYDVHAEELRLKGRTNPHWPEMLDILASNLNSAQVNTLRSGAQLPITELTLPQRIALGDVILTATLSPTRNQWAGLLEILRGLPKGYMRVEFYNSPELCGFTPVDRNKLLFPASFVIMARQKVESTNNNPEK